MKTPKQANKLMFFSLIYMFIIPIALGIIIFATNNEHKIEEINNFFLLVQDFILIGIPIVVASALTKIRPSELFAHSRLSPASFFTVIALTALFAPTMQFVAAVTAQLVPPTASDTIYTYLSETRFIISFIAIAVIPAIFEELMFRGCILSGFRRSGIVMASVICGLYFGIFHMDIYQLLYASLAGMFFSFLVIFTNSIYSSMLAHLLINGTQVIMAKLVLHFYSIDEVLKMSGESNPMAAILPIGILAMVTFPIFILLAVHFAKSNKDKARAFTTRPTELAVEPPIDIWFFLVLIAAAVFYFVNSLSQ